jgi:hypothetical protein
MGLQRRRLKRLNFFHYWNIIFLMMKQTFFILYLIITVLPINASKFYTLEKVMKPTAFFVCGGHVFVAGEKTVQQYSLKSGEFLRFIGRMGKGPGEFEAEPKICFQPPNKLLVQTFFKKRIDKINSLRYVN